MLESLQRVAVILTLRGKGALHSERLAIMPLPGGIAPSRVMRPESSDVTFTVDLALPRIRHDNFLAQVGAMFCVGAPVTAIVAALRSLIS